MLDLGLASPSFSVLSYSPHLEDLPKLSSKQHFAELRSRLIKSLLFVGCVTVLATFFTDSAISLLVRPLAELIRSQGLGPKQLVFSGLGEGFFIHFYIAVLLALLLSFPYLIWHIYAFVSPGLYERERKLIRPYLFLAPLLFIFGLVFNYTAIIPISWRFFLSFETIVPLQDSSTLPIVLQANISRYLGTVVQLSLAFGLAFQLPIVLIILCKLELIKVSTLIQYRRHAIVAVFIVAALLTPPDVISQVLLALPLLLLYECSVLCLGGYKKTQKKSPSQ